jgi:hypothetical protein
MTEERYGFTGYCQHGINPGMCIKCKHPKPMTQDYQDHEQRETPPINDDTRDLARTIDEVATELHEENNG